MASLSAHTGSRDPSLPGTMNFFDGLPGEDPLLKPRPEDLRTYAEWQDAGYNMAKGAKSEYTDDDGNPLYCREQVYKPYRRKSGWYASDHYYLGGDDFFDGF